jgi:hypothetical protein
MSKTPSNVKNFGGIDTRFARESSRFSEGENFYTKGGALFSRPGTTLVTSVETNPFTGDILAMIQAPLPGQDTVLIAQNGYHLWHLVDGTWVDKYTLSSPAPVKACRFINKLLLVNGTDRIQLDIATQVYSTLVVAGTDAIPALEYLSAWKFRAFGWSPSGSDSHMLKFCGYDGNSMIDPTVWPPDFTLNIGGSAGSPIFGVYPCGNHLLALTETTYVPIFGNTEEDFEVSTSGTTSVLRPGVIEEINGLIIWLGKDINGKLVINLYSGTEPIAISDPIQGYIGDISLSTVYTKSFLNQFWVISPGATTTTAYVYDTSEKEWYIYTFPFRIVSGTVFGEYLNDDYIYLGSSPNVIKFNPTASTDILNNTITTSFVWGPINKDNRTLKPKTVHVIAEPENDFDLSVVQIIDDNPEPTALVLSFESGTTLKQVTETLKASRDKGYNMSYRFSSLNKINKLNGLTVVFKERGVK